MRKMLPDGPVRQKMSLEGDLINVHVSTCSILRDLVS
jgi:hypothetical protein